MRTRLAAVPFCLFLFSATALAQGSARKPGLWEISTTMTFQQSPFPAGMTPPPNSPFGAGARTTQVCLTQAQIDKFGGPMPPTQNGCAVSNMNLKPAGMTADIVCSGATNGKGTVTMTFLDSEHTKATVHFTGALQAGPRTMPIEWTAQSSGTLKSSDCGGVAPAK